MFVLKPKKEIIFYANFGRKRNLVYILSWTHFSLSFIVWKMTKIWGSFDLYLLVFRLNYEIYWVNIGIHITQKIKFSIKDFFSKCDQNFEHCQTEYGKILMGWRSNLILFTLSVFYVILSKITDCFFINMANNDSFYSRKNYFKLIKCFKLIRMVHLAM